MNMAFELQQNLKLQQQLVMTPQLQMAIKLLQLSRLELVEMVRQEMENNPTLEETENIEPAEELQAAAAEAAPNQEVSITEKFDERLDWHHYMDEYSSTGKVHFESETRESPNYEAFTASKTSLADHLRWQLLMTQPSSEEEMIGSIIIGNLNRFGFMADSLDEVAENAGVSVNKVEAVLLRMQEFDPPGICARNLGESLLIQARQLGIDTPLLTELITNHMKNLENKRYSVITKELKTSVNAIIAAVELIRTLDPRPADRYGGEDEQIYILPDVYVRKDGDKYVVFLNDDDIPQLHISSYYKNAVRKGERINRETRSYLKDRLRSAEWLIKSIQQRKKTIFNVMTSIVKFQRDFFDFGIAHLKPMVLRDVAEDIQMHESTISRVTTNKYAHTPHGIFELKFFFNSSINRSNGETIASASVQEEIRRIVSSEDPRKPFSDQKISDQLVNQLGIEIARRTIAKYRELMGILPSSKRKQL